MDEHDAREIALGGAPLKCSHCASRRFVERSALLNTRGMTLFGLDWLNEGARVFACSACGHLEWFAAVPGDAGMEQMPTPTECLSCGAVISPEAERCDACGWSYQGGAGDEA